MNPGRHREPSRPDRWWAVSSLVLAALAAFLVLRYALWRPSPLEPLPVVALAQVDSEVARSLESARQNVQADEGSATAWGDLGGVCLAYSLGSDAELCFRNAQRLDPSDYRWPYLLAISTLAKDPQQSLPFLRRAAELAPDRPHVQLRLAEVLLDSQLHDEARSVVEQTLQRAPDDPRAQFAKAQLLFAEGQLAESKAWCERVVVGAAQKRSPHLLLAQLCRRLGDAEGQARALAALPDATTDWDDPDLALIQTLRDQGWQLLALDRIAREGRAAGTSDPSRDATARHPASAAEAALRDKLAGNPDNERFRFQLGLVLLAQQDFEPAAREFRRAAQLKPDHVDAHYNLGHALRKAGLNEEAEAAFAATIRLSPGHVFARANLAELLLDAGEPDEARSHLQVAARLAPRDPKVSELLARLPVQPP